MPRVFIATTAVVHLAIELLVLFNQPHDFELDLLPAIRGGKRQVRFPIVKTLLDGMVGVRHCALLC